MSRRRVAVVGSGVAGLSAAYVLSRSCHVTLLEADERLGGHADTHVVPVDVDGRRVSVPVDTGFIVHNERTYPVLLRIFSELGVTTRLSEMSMSIRDEVRGLEWAGALGAGGVFPTWRNAVDPGFWRMLTQVPRFHRRARALLRETDDGADDLATLREFLDAGGFDQHFRDLFMEPLVAAVWSTDDSRALDYPARYLFRFLAHHGMLQVFGSPPWRTVVGGSAAYVAAVAERLDEVRTGAKVTGVVETPAGVEVTDGTGRSETFDAVVVATHPHQALAMLTEPTAAQRDVLGAMPYSVNAAQLHTDTSLLPTLPRARASWNYRRRRGGDEQGEGGGAVTVTYDLTRLMRLDEAYGVTDRRFLVTLGGADLVDPATVIDTMTYEHPLYTAESVAAQRRLGECDSDRLVFAGAYHGWGFHEDGARSGVAAAERLGADWTEPGRGRRGPTASTSPRVYATTIRHTRRTPWRRSFAHRSHTWVVDLDHLPRRGPLRGTVLGTFEPRDHLGDPAHPDRSLREAVEAFCAARGLDVTGGRILMAANPRAFGYCFNPISVFWCFAASGDLTGVVVEVHNTYGDRHAYLVRPDDQGRASTDKQMYVSPFHGVGGRYEIAVPVPTETDLHVAVSLASPEGEDFSASLTGTAVAVPGWRIAPVALRHSLLIRLHGTVLWARRLPIRPRPHHPPQEGVS